MEKDDRLPVGLFARRDIHIRHLQRLQVITEGKELNRIGILVLLKANTESTRFFCHNCAPFAFLASGPWRSVFSYVKAPMPV
ncbi:MAG TPA: hypothetical protein VK594_17390, partial [Streptosporangiaceae bacterium]|nr:hypothetical protein [Streptosporangiaceae bacterium]